MIPHIPEQPTSPPVEPAPVPDPAERAKILGIDTASPRWYLAQQAAKAIQKVQREGIDREFYPRHMRGRAAIDWWNEPSFQLGMIYGWILALIREVYKLTDAELAAVRFAPLPDRPCSCLLCKGYQPQQYRLWVVEGSKEGAPSRMMIVGAPSENTAIAHAQPTFNAPPRSIEGYQWRALEIPRDERGPLFDLKG